MLREDWGAFVKVTVMFEVMVTFADWDLVVSATEVAVMVTVLPEGTADGAV